jgi:serine/threonine-protein kinase
MELLEGQDLEARLEHDPQPDGREVVEIVTQLARALEKAHAVGIVHRDIKPSNVFLCDAGDGGLFVKLLDFGIAKGAKIQDLDSSTKTGAMMGTPYYMSPEQVIGARDVDARTDLWSVGVVVFEALCGRRPFDAETVGALAIRIHTEPLPVPSEVAPHMPPSFDAWFAKACARERTDRFASAKELSESLAAALGHDGSRPKISVPATSRKPRAAPAEFGNTTTAFDVEGGNPERPSRSRVPLIGAAMFALGCGAVIAWFQFRGHAVDVAPTAEKPTGAAHASDSTPVTAPASAISAPRDPPRDTLETAPTTAPTATSRASSGANAARGQAPATATRIAPHASPSSSPTTPPPKSTAHDIY